ncbi:hypothetical protein ONS95_007465 [Cadophora gregata]|uniref:uncharacterized protein n=1 Tax=Cadophora gregata TaxID=51156 RepID=UPI0026DB8469|nr:uncharacterized protein ONS95_007465 [Cadophora gregata]KAK0118579.1 hypothetical protein ONS96_011671 [Cadophora gregata f. sp. sojae]KAK0125834.1 hypothetical protein ONS95_007465 [Cadophora gregata]
MAKEKRKLTKDNPQSSPLPSPSQQSDANMSSIVLPLMPKRSDGNNDTHIVGITSSDFRIQSEMIVGTNAVNSDSVGTSDYSMEYMQRLRSLVAPKTALEETGYVLQPLSEDAIQRKKRCGRCGKTMLKGRVDGQGKGTEKENRQSLLGGEGDKGVDDQQIEENKDEIPFMEDFQPKVEECGTSKEDGHRLALNPPQILKPVVRCRFHDGIVTYKVWSCCGKHVSADPCQAAEFHLARAYPAGQLESLWAFYPTPCAGVSHQVRAAVAIDCEMGTAKSGDSELIRVTLIDYFSSEVLVDKLVYPDVAMEHYNTRFSGVTRKDMEYARRSRQCLLGKKRAREAVWKFVDPHTIVVGHSAHNDLTAMRWIHDVVVDTWLVESENKKAKEVEAKAKAERDRKKQEGSQTQNSPSQDLDKLKEAQQHKESPTKKVKGRGTLSLKTLTWERLRREIQTTGRKGHDSLEDAIATRDLAHWNVLTNC